MCENSIELPETCKAVRWAPDALSVGVYSPEMSKFVSDPGNYAPKSPSTNRFAD